MHRPVLVLTVLAAAGAASAVEEVPGIAARPGESFASEIRPAGDSDLYAVERLEGARLGAVVRALGPAPGVSPLRVAILDRNCETVLGSRIGRRAVVVAPVRVPATGRFFVRVTGGGSGPYSLRILGRDAPARLTRDLAFGADPEAPLTHSFEAFDGALLSLDVRFRGGLVSIRDLLDPDGNPVPGIADAGRYGGGVTTGVLRVRKFPLAAGSGVYTLRLDRLLGDPAVSIRVRIQSPRLSPLERRLRVLGPDEPFLDSVEPADGGRLTPLVLRGGNFPLSGVRVFVGGVEATDVATVSATEIHATAPAGPLPGLHDVLVVGPDGQGDVLAGAFRYLPPPAIAAMDPVEGPLAGGIEVEFGGVGFRPGVHLTIDGAVQAGVPVAVSAIAARFLLPAHAAGDVVLGVEDDLGNRAEAPGKFRYLAFPVVGALAPAAAPRAGGFEISVAGTGFASDGRLLVDGAEVEFEFVGATGIRFVSPARDAAGMVDVAFEDRFGQRGTLAAGLRLFELVDRSADVPSILLQEDFGGVASLLLDFEGDGDLDVVVASPSAVNAGATSATRLLRNDDGVLTNVTATKFPASSAFEPWNGLALAKGDLDADGLPEILLGRDDGSDAPGDASQLRVFEANASGAFFDATEEFLPEPGAAHDFRARAVAVGDLDGDGDQDILLSGAAGFDYEDDDGEPRHGAATRVLLQGSHGLFEDATATSLPGVTGADDDLRAVANLLADVDGDGDLDAVLLHDDGFGGAPALRVLANAGDGTFSALSGALPSVSGENWAGRTVVAADLDGDGDLDLVLSRETAASDDRAATRVLLNDGNGQFADVTVAALGPVNGTSTERFEARALAVADVDGDGGVDIVLGRDPSSGAGPFTRVLLADGEGGWRVLDASVPGLDNDAWGASALLAGDLDGDGDADLVLTGAGRAGADGRRTRIWRNDP
jgi:hypothetical protein